MQAPKEGSNCISLMYFISRSDWLFLQLNEMVSYGTFSGGTVQFDTLVPPVAVECQS